MVTPNWLTAFVALLSLTQSGFVSRFDVDKASLVSTGRNDYFILEPGYTLELAGGDTHLTITVTGETAVIDGVTTRVVEERETAKGQLVEVSRNFFAIDPKTRDVYYFGEDVDIYKDGKPASREGSWLAGVNGATFGLAMPGTPTLHMKYQQEVAPKVAMDRADVVSLSTRLTTPAGVFDGCLRTEETSPLEPGVKEYKVYAKGIGLVQDDDVKLVSHRSR